MKAAMRALKNHALSYSDVEVKVREATSNDPWSCPLSLMRELSRATHDYVDYPKLFAMLWKRLADVEHVMHVTKALQLLDFLIRHGSERFVLDVKRRQRDIAALQRYKHYDQSNIDDAKEARAKAKQVHELLANETRLQAERQAAEKQNRQLAGGGGQQLTEDEEAEEELYRARKRQFKAQRSKQPHQHDSKDAGDDDSDVYGGVDAVNSKGSNRGRQAAEEAEQDVDEQDELEEREEKRHMNAVARRGKSTSGGATTTSATSGRTAAAAARSGANAERGGGVSFEPVSEEEMDDDSATDGGATDGQQQQRSSRVTKRTVRRKTTSSSVQEAEGDEVTQELEEQEERTQAQRSNVSAHNRSSTQRLHLVPYRAASTHLSHRCWIVFAVALLSLWLICAVLVESAASRSAPHYAAGSTVQWWREYVISFVCYSSCVVLRLVCCCWQSVVRKQSSFQPDGSTASSVYSSVAESPIPLLDELLSQQPVQPQQLPTGSSRLRGQQRGAAASASSTLPRPSRSTRSDVWYGAGDVGDEVDIPSVADELDLLSLASQPNVYLVPATQHGRSAELDMLTGTPLMDEQRSPQPTSLTTSGRTPRSKGPSASASSPHSLAASTTATAAAVRRGQSSGAPNTAAAPTSSPSSGATAGRRSAQPQSRAAAGKLSAVSAKKAALLAQLAALDQEDNDNDNDSDTRQRRRQREPVPTELPPYAEAEADDEQQQYQSAAQQQQYYDSQPQTQRSQPTRGSSTAPQPRPAAATQPRRAVQTVAQQRYYDEQDDDEADSVEAQQQQYDEPALLDTLTAAPTPSVPLSSKSANQRTSAAVRKTAPQQPVMSDVWSDNSLTDLDHLASSSSALPSVAQRAPKGHTMAEMQKAAPFPSASSVASSMLDDEALQSAFARRAPANSTNSFGAVGGKAPSGAARRKPQPASTDIFFQN